MSAKVAKGVKGFKSKGKFFKIMGPKGEDRQAFQILEEYEEVKSPDDGSFEEKIQEQELIYYQYINQRNIAKKIGANPDEVEIPEKAKEYMKAYGADVSKQDKMKASQAQRNSNKQRKTQLIQKLNKNKKGRKKGKFGRRRQKGRRRRRRNREWKGRGKRMAIRDENRYWTNGIIPYVFTSEVKSKEERLGRLRAHRRYEYWTCIRFVPWTKTTAREYGLDHNNYLKHVDNKGCWSVLGNTRRNGQKISCCMDESCVHEIGHAMGLHHEQKSYLHHDYIRINFQNVMPDRVKEYEEEDPSSSKTFGYYDLGTSMHYNKFMFSANAEPTMTVLDPNLEYLMMTPDPYNYYMFYEISQTHRCQELRCPDFTMQCKNGGYVSYIRDICTCRCPEGLDPKTGCTTVYRGDASLRSASWPSSGFSMLKPNDGCPEGFKEGSLSLGVPSSDHSELYNIDTEAGDDELTLKFCTKEESPGTDTQWEPGQYCILSSNTKCPSGFEDGFVVIDNNKNPRVKSLPVPDIKVDENVGFHFCCRNDGSWFDQIYLPSSQPFFLFERGYECQEVKDMMTSSQWLMIENDLSGENKIVGSAPDITIRQDRNYFINVCYYTPINYDCGDVIELSRDNPSTTISSPNFPNEYNPRQRCQWTITSPQNTRMRMTFEKFEVELREDDKCGDYLEVKFTLPGHPGINYCGSTFEPTILTERNYLGLVFTSGPDVVQKGFKATISLLTDHDLCYTGKGENYRGNVNFTKDFEPCLPWSEVQHCPHSTFNSHDLDDGLDSNFCRNPGDGTSPWCYIHRENCERNYCDPCGLGHCFDKYFDCEELLSNGTQVCGHDIDIKYGCRKSCGYCKEKPDLPVDNVKCKTPNDIDDAKPTSSLKKKYGVGENVTYSCNGGLEKETRQCLTDGSWSGGNFVCGRCPNKWVPFKKSCYKFFDVEVNKTAANELCHAYDAVVTSSKDADEDEFLVHMRGDMRPIWLGLEEVAGRGRHRWQEDMSQVTWTKWKKGKSSECAYMDRDGQWSGIRCSVPKYLAVVCKFIPSDRRKCVDASSNCVEKIESEPGTCKEYPDFAWQSCPASCGLCQNKGKNCKIPRYPRNAIQLSRGSIISTGDVIEYDCRKGYVLTGGNLRRACLSSGKLTGEPPKCTSEHSLPTANFDVELRQRSRDGGADGGAYTAQNEAMRIHKDGRLVKWEFYSIYDGVLALQVWRKSKTVGKKISFELVGQNVIKSSKNHRIRRYVVPSAEQINVMKGDVVGFFLPKDLKGGITLDKCNKKYSGRTYGNQLVYDGRKKLPNDWIVGETFTFKPDSTDCKIISMKAFVI
ncbi:uncharacterized protein LOC133174938 [Saccostrea echinata]|uniref:uncharacterized protein LOC133174938 n=1 Tax=Saccostrea echinata TaxID=191078 RepID=UPI002A7F616B|nr:uncharacterized protein LOC133174938 [Saccostrea echinata]